MFEIIFTWPLNFCKQKPGGGGGGGACKVICGYLKNLFFLICGFQIPDSEFQSPVPDFGFRVLGLPVF